MKTKTLLRLYLTMSLLEEPLFWGPILLVALATLAHMSTGEIFLSEAIATALVIMLDAPSGVLADMIGRRTSVILGKMCFLSSILILAFMDRPFDGYTANILWAIGVSLRSGAESALIFDELKKRDALHEYHRLMKRTHSYWFFMTAITTLATGYLAEISLRLPLLLSIPGVCVSSLLIFFFPRDAGVTHRHTFHAYRTHLKEAFREVLSSERLRSLLLWLALLAMMGKLYFFTYNPYLELAKVPYYHVGIIFSLINVFAFITSRYAFWINAKIGAVGFSMGFWVQGITMLVQAFVTHAVCGWLFSVQGAMRGYINTLSEPLLNKEISSERRATMLSFDSSLKSVLQVAGFIIVAPFAGDISALLALLGVFAILFGFLSRKV